MIVKRIVANIYAADLAPLRRFYVRDPAGRIINLLSHL